MPSIYFVILLPYTDLINFLSVGNFRGLYHCLAAVRNRYVLWASKLFVFVPISRFCIWIESVYCVYHAIASQRTIIEYLSVLWLIGFVRLHHLNCAIADIWLSAGLISQTWCLGIVALLLFLSEYVQCDEPNFLFSSQYLCLVKQCMVRVMNVLWFDISALSSSVVIWSPVNCEILF